MDGQQVSFSIGAFQCHSLLDGYVNYPIQNFYSNVPKDLVEEELRNHSLPVDYVTTPYTFLLVRTGQNNVLVDAGAGDFFPTTGALVESLRLTGLEPEEIDTLIISHAHPDHIGGLLDERGRPVYQNARYVMTREEWNFWFSDAAAARTTPNFISVARKNLGPLKERVDLVDGRYEVVPGVYLLPAFGHTPGHAIVWISSQDKTLVYVADTVLHPLHLEHPDWLPVYDILPAKAAASKQSLFDEVAGTDVLVLGQHFPPFPSLGRVTHSEPGWVWMPIES